MVNSLPKVVWLMGYIKYFDGLVLSTLAGSIVRIFLSILRRSHNHYSMLPPVYKGLVSYQ